MDIFTNEETYRDYIKIYEFRHKIDDLDIIASDTIYPDKERVIALEKMYELYNQERDILEKYGE